ncbi:MAG: DUF5320 domain-containing protein [Methanothrix sp.]
MPGGDGTGPAGYGPRTGRGMGYCSGFDAPGYARLGYGRPFGAGRGGRRGRGGGIYFRSRQWPGFRSFGPMPFAFYGPYRPAAYRVR